jgi:hypothetical protein
MRGKLQLFDSDQSHQSNYQYAVPWSDIPRDEMGNLRTVDMIRIDIMKKAMSGPDGLMDVKSGLMRLKVWMSGAEYIPQFELMGPEEIVRALRYMMDFHIETLHEAMTRKLSDDNAEVKKKIASLGKQKGKK